MWLLGSRLFFSCLVLDEKGYLVEKSAMANQPRNMKNELRRAEVGYNIPGRDVRVPGKEPIPMRRSINIARHGIDLMLALIGLMCAMTMVLEPVALAQVNSSWLPAGKLGTPRSSHTATVGWGGAAEDIPLK